MLSGKTHITCCYSIVSKINCSTTCSRGTASSQHGKTNVSRACKIQGYNTIIKCGEPLLHELQLASYLHKMHVTSKGTFVPHCPHCVIVLQHLNYNRHVSLTSSGTQLHLLQNRHHEIIQHHGLGWIVVDPQFARATPLPSSCRPPSVQHQHVALQSLDRAAAELLQPSLGSFAVPLQPFAQSWLLAAWHLPVVE